jgi:hypothetical protein
MGILEVSKSLDISLVRNSSANLYLEYVSTCSKVRVLTRLLRRYSTNLLILIQYKLNRDIVLGKELSA